MMNIIGIGLFFLCLACFLFLILGMRKLWQSSNGFLVVYGKRSISVCRYTADDFLGPWTSQILDRRGKVFVADGDKIRRLKKRELPRHLSEDEWRAMENWFRWECKICVIRNHELTSRVQEKLAWGDRILGKLPVVPKSSGGRKDEIIVG